MPFSLPDQILDQRKIMMLTEPSPLSLQDNVYLCCTSTCNNAQNSLPFDSSLCQDGLISIQAGSVCRFPVGNSSSPPAPAPGKVAPPSVSLSADASDVGLLMAKQPRHVDCPHDVLHVTLKQSSTATPTASSGVAQSAGTCEVYASFLVEAQPLTMRCHAQLQEGS